MREILNPKKGFVKPTIRPEAFVGYSGMVRGKTRRKKIPSQFLRDTVARNVKARAAIQFPECENVPLEIVKNSDGAATNRLNKSTVQRIMAGETSATLEQMEGLAYALDLSPYQLLMPNMDAKNPQVARGAAEGEEKAYSMDDLRKAAREAAQEAIAHYAVPSRARPKR